MKKIGLTIAAAVLALPLGAQVAPTTGTAAPEAIDLTELQPFTHVAYIPAGADLSTIKFESVKAVKVATKTASITYGRYCGQAHREPGGSMFCPSVQDEYPVAAYRVTYSYRGPAMASDESGSTRFTFSVNMRPEDLNPAVLQTVSARKINRVAAAEDFKITTSRDLVPRTVIDDEKSTFCEGRYTDGGWIHLYVKCEDQAVYKTVMVPSDYITVKVNPVSSSTTVAALE
jgi:hypothetical protein